MLTASTTDAVSDLPKAKLFWLLCSKRTLLGLDGDYTQGTDIVLRCHRYCPLVTFHLLLQ